MLKCSKSINSTAGRPRVVPSLQEVCRAGSNNMNIKRVFFVYFVVVFLRILRSLSLKLLKSYTCIDHSHFIQDFVPSLAASPLFSVFAARCAACFAFPWFLCSLANCPSTTPTALGATRQLAASRHMFLFLRAHILHSASQPWCLAGSQWLHWILQWHNWHQ